MHVYVYNLLIITIQMLCLLSQYLKTFCYIYCRLAKLANHENFMLRVRTTCGDPSENVCCLNAISNPFMIRHPEVKDYSITFHRNNEFLYSSIII